MTIELRTSWGARLTRGTTYLASTLGVKAHYTGGLVSDSTLTDHNRCRAAIRTFQNAHMDGHGWNDLGYSMWVCNHTTGIGRGPHVLPAANGPGLNSGHYAILFLVGNAGVTAPTDAMITNFHEARRYLMEHGNAGAQIKGHRDGYPTDCPGDPIYAWVKAGASLPGNPVVIIPPPSPGEDLVPVEYAAFGLGATTNVPRGKWFNLPWDTEFSDPTDVHSASGSSVLLGFPCVYAGVEFNVHLAGLPTGTEVKTRLAEYRYNNAVTPPVDFLEEAGLEDARYVSPSGVVHHSGSGMLQEGRKLRCQIYIPDGPEIVTALGAYVHAPFTR